MRYGPLLPQADRAIVLIGMAKFYCHRFSIRTHRAFIGSFFIVDMIGWLDVRQKHLQSAFRTAPPRNRRQWRRIKAIWLWHGSSPDVLQAGAQPVSLSPMPVGRGR